MTRHWQPRHDSPWTGSILEIFDTAGTVRVTFSTEDYLQKEYKRQWLLILTKRYLPHPAHVNFVAPWTANLFLTLTRHLTSFPVLKKIIYIFSTVVLLWKRAAIHHRLVVSRASPRLLDFKDPRVGGVHWHWVAFSRYASARVC